MRTKLYEPRGVIVPFIKAVHADPERMWTVAEACRVMGVKSNKVGGSLTYALRNQILYRQKRDGQTVYRGCPFPEGNLDPPAVKTTVVRRIKTTDGEWLTTGDDPRVPKVIPGWKPPQMVASRS